MDTPDQTPAEAAGERADRWLVHARNAADRAGVGEDQAVAYAGIAQAEQTRALRLTVAEVGGRIARAIEKAGKR